MTEVDTARLRMPTISLAREYVTLGWASNRMLKDTDRDFSRRANLISYGFQSSSMPKSKSRTKARKRPKLRTGIKRKLRRTARKTRRKIGKRLIHAGEKIAG
ncbi:MAG: hypothetical protein QW390_05005 [Candidatus Bathyarchaeia archaeon]